MLARKKGGQIMLFEIDQWILNKHEKFAHFTQRNLGFDCFWWAKATVYIAWIFLVAKFFMMSYFNDSFSVFLVTSGYIFSILAIPIAMRIISIKRIEYQVKEVYHPNGESNPLKGRLSTLRLFGPLGLSIIYFITGPNDSMFDLFFWGWPLCFLLSLLGFM